MLFAAIALLGALAQAMLRAEGEARCGRGGDSRADEEGGTCAASTRSGKPCSRPAEPGSKYCWQHQ